MRKPNPWIMKPICTFEQVMHNEIYKTNGTFSHHKFVVYAHNQLVKRKIMCDEIKERAEIIKGPWIIIGDFNNVLKVTDIIGGTEVQMAEFINLERMMEEIGLYDHETNVRTRFGFASIP